MPLQILEEAAQEIMQGRPHQVEQETSVADRTFASQPQDVLSVASIDGQQHQAVNTEKPEAVTVGLLTLPAEIRISIYVLVVVVEDPPYPGAKYMGICVGCHDRGDAQERCHYCNLLGFLDLPSGRSPALFRVCRQIHHEALPVYYGANTFQTFLDMSFDEQYRREQAWADLALHARGWLARIGSERAGMIKRFEVIASRKSVDESRSRYNAHGRALSGEPWTRAEVLDTLDAQTYGLAVGAVHLLDHEHDRDVFTEVNS
ncbi:hypothetical protein LTR53_014898 [Teratosphaeriaceae sp. CCFEE 6253]|nr:hypothetical protein LTR53_014898 [Teratosphaeriaceae sp. CCFEE 6253]